MGSETFPELVKDTILFSDEEFCNLQSTEKQPQDTVKVVHNSSPTLFPGHMCMCMMSWAVKNK